MTITIVVVMTCIIVGLLCCLRMASIADDEMERMMAEKDSE